MKNTATLLLIGIVILSCSTDKSEIIIGLKESIHHDDFEYSVIRFMIAPKMGESVTLEAKGNFYMVTFQVVNKAIRVIHNWNNSIAYIISENGTIYENKRDAQIFLDKIHPMNWKEEYVTPAQSKDSIQLVFELPATVKKPYLSVRGETLMGDFFDGGKFKRTKIELFER